MFLICQNSLILYTTLIFITTNVTYSHDWQEYEHEITRNISEALVEIINGLYVQHYHLRQFNFHIKVKNQNRKYLPEFQRIMDETMQLMGHNIGVRMHNATPITIDSERHFSVLLVDSKESLEFLYRDLTLYHLFVEGSYYIVLKTFPNIYHYYDELLEIYQLNWRNGVSHADVLVHAVHNVILLFLSYPFTPYHCKGVAPIVHNKFSNGRWLHKKFYNAKYSNLHGCPLVCATWEDMPYLEVIPDPEGGPPTYFGLEGHLLEYLSEQSNFTIEIYWMSQDEINQTVFDEQGVFNKFFESGIDFVIGAFHYKPTTLEDPFAPTTIYYLSSYYFIVSSKTEAFDPFTKLLFPFHIEIWFTLVFLFTFGNVFLFVILFLNRKLKNLVLGRENKNPAYNMLVISLGGAVSKDPKVPFSRFLLVLWLMATFILRTIYQAFLFYFIKSDARKPLPSTIADLWKNQYSFFMTEDTLSAISSLPGLMRRANILNDTVLQSFNLLRHHNELEEPNRVSILTAYEYFGYYKFITPINYDFHVVPDTLFTQQLSIYMKKNSPFLKRFNMNIKRFISEGLMNRWERYLVFTGNERKPKDDTPKEMKVSHLKGALRLLIFGIVGSSLVFVIEMLMFSGRKLCKRLKRKWIKLMKRNRKRYYN